MQQDCGLATIHVTATSGCVPSVTDFRTVPVSIPLPLHRPFVIFVIDERDLALSESDFFHAV